MKNEASDRKIFSFFNKADLILLLLFLLLGFGSMLALRLPSSAGSTVIISVGGEEIGRYPLDADREIKVDTEYGHNTVTIRSGTVSVTKSDCPNHDCERFGAVSRPPQSILCIPHRLVVRITGETDVDAVLY